MPTTLPRPRRARQKRSPARVVFDFLFTTTLVVSALSLTFVVLMREEQYALGRPANAAQPIEQTADRSAADLGGEMRTMSPEN